MATQKKRCCYRCGSSYDQQRSIGALECRSHIGKYNYCVDGNNTTRFQWECCGASRFTDELYKGCISVDHSSSDKEFNEIMKMPYAFMPYKWIEETTYPGNVVATFLSKGSTYKNLEIKCAHRNEPFLVDMSKCDYLKSSTNNSDTIYDLDGGDPFKGREWNLYTFEEQDDDNEIYSRDGSGGGSSFVPFVVVRRVSENK
jgi:hypothetical protein